MRSFSIIKSICDLDILRWLYSNSLIKPQIQSQQHEQTITQDLKTSKLIQVIFAIYSLLQEKEKEKLWLKFLSKRKNTPYKK